MAKITRIKASDGPRKEEKSDEPTITRKKVVVKDKKTEKTKRAEAKKAIKLAQRSPSACNRQGVRVYGVDKSKAQIIIEQLEGIGGFANEIDKFIGSLQIMRDYYHNLDNRPLIELPFSTIDIIKEEIDQTPIEEFNTETEENNTNQENNKDSKENNTENDVKETLEH